MGSIGFNLIYQNKFQKIFRIQGADELVVINYKH
jgi:hypothetical protein